MPGRLWLERAGRLVVCLETGPYATPALLSRKSHECCVGELRAGVGYRIARGIARSLQACFTSAATAYFIGAGAVQCSTVTGILGYRNS